MLEKTKPPGRLNRGFTVSYPFYSRYVSQTSTPIELKKGKYYYMETVMKDDHQPDHLEVGLVTPDGTQYSYIPGSKFLWTILPLPHCMYRKSKASFKGSIILVQVDSILLIVTCLMPLITKDIAWMMFDDV